MNRPHFSARTRPFFSGLLLTGALLLAGPLAGCDDESSQGGNISVFKYTGALQCREDSGIGLADMQMELVNAGIDVICAQPGADGRLYSASCGSGTGRLNIFEIRRANLEDAQAIGFEGLFRLPDAFRLPNEQGETCG